jgi:hypothetical protein
MRFVLLVGRAVVRLPWRRMSFPLSVGVGLEATVKVERGCSGTGVATSVPGLSEARLHVDRYVIAVLVVATVVVVSGGVVVDVAFGQPPRLAWHGRARCSS